MGAKVHDKYPSERPTGDRYTERRGGNHVKKEAEVEVMPIQAGEYLRPQTLENAGRNPREPSEGEWPRLGFQSSCYENTFLLF